MSHITQILPKRVKPSELTMINSVWINLMETPAEFVDNPDITYLWVLKNDDDGNKTVIVGIEEPWNYKSAFNESVYPALEKMKKHYSATKEFWTKQGEKDGMGGHPTLAAWFSKKDGQASCHAGFAYIGGELTNQGDTWLLSNKSGRFGRGKEGSNKLEHGEIQDLLNQAKAIVEEKTKIHVNTEVIIKKA